MKTLFAIAIALPILALNVSAQETGQTDSPLEWEAETFEGLKFRSIGPAFMSGRIADIAIHPGDENVWYVAAGSGGVWKTENAGVTWTPIFDDQPVYSIGCVTIDPNDPNVVWVGTGENVGGRHVGFGDGVYRSGDGGQTWTNMGLVESEHISKIVIHPRNSDVIWVAAQGPLWNKGGQRGLFKSNDGGQSWQRVLGDTEWTGVTDVVLDPRNPSRMFAATWQRHRTVAAYLGGGPESGVHRSDDGGTTWTRLRQGLPEGSMGKIGLAISPQKPDTLYAAIEMNQREGGVFRSTDGGASWEKRSATVSGGTGPHYYQELYASPHQYDLIYLADVRMQVSSDGGKTFTNMDEKHKHSDNHALAFRVDDPDYLLAGCDGGLYESFDNAKNWRFIDNLPLTQFYKIALDDSGPFYNVYGGTQDNSTEGGPIRTDNAHGIQNSDWRVVLDWDGHQPATEPGNPNVVYAERQEGFLSRIDMKTGEVVDIQPQPDSDEEFERFNWDAPILVSPHNPTRLYFASYRVWRSDNRGDQWTAISGDLTRGENRLQLPIMGSTQSWDSPWDMYAMSTYNTITSLAESPQKEGLIYAGTDDGLIQVTENGGNNWRQIAVGALPGVPATAFVNDLRADLHDADTVYVALDNHKFGDFQPYLLRSRDRGQTWESITANLPDKLLVWRLVQDHVQPNLMFLATEFGVYFTINSGGQWTKLTGGMPTISLRDIHIHRRDDDLVAASFGRGIFVLDDIRPFRELSAAQMESDATLFSTRHAWWYFPRPHLGFEGGKGDQGASHFVAPNPPFGAVFTYYLREGFPTAEEQRQENEKQQRAAGRANQVPDWDVLEAERMAAAPQLWLIIKDQNESVVRRIACPTGNGFHRVAWNLRYPTPDAIKLVEDPPPMWGGPPQGLMAAPGTYTATLVLHADGNIRPLDDPQSFEVVQMRRGSLEGATAADVAAFWREYESAVRTHSAMQVVMAGLMKKSERLQKVILNSTFDTRLDQRIGELRTSLLKLDGKLNGHRSKQKVGEKFKPIVADRLFAVSRGVDRSTYGPTPSHRRSLEIATEAIAELHAEISAARQQMTDLIKELIDADAPWVEGEPLPEID